MIATKTGRGAKGKTLELGFLLVAALIAVMLLAPSPAHADTTITVNSMADAGDNNLGNGTCATKPFPVGTEPECTLRAAIQEANANGESDTIIFDPALSGTITLILGELEIANDTPANDLLVEGSGANKITVSGNDASRVFVIGTDAEATIKGLKISNGRTTSLGGGIFNDGGTLTLTNSSVSENTATPRCEPGSCFGGGAGGIANVGIANVKGEAQLTDSTVSGNSAGGSVGGGGIANQDSEMQLTNSTVSGNRTTTDGSGILNYFHLDATTLVLTNSTVSGNSATNGNGGGIYNRDGGTTTLSNTIVARNSAPTNPDADGKLTSKGYNLIGDTTGATGFVASDLTNTNPLLGPLQNNGGPTNTHALLQGSPALNVIPNATNGCGTQITTDQRGVSRPQEGKCEIGSFELKKPPDTTPPNTTITSGPSARL